MAAIHPSAQAAAPDLGAAADFAILGGSTVTNTGASFINGDLGVSPGSAVTGFPPGILTGTIYTASDGPAFQAHADTLAAYNVLVNEAATVSLTGQNLGGLTLTSGTYSFDTSAQLTGVLTLDTQGDINAFFHFKIGTALTTASLSSVLVVGGGSVGDIFWQIGSSATLGLDTAFTGNILALESITLNTGAGINFGRALAINGAVTLDTNSISFMLGSDFGTIWKGGTSNLWSDNNWSSTPSGSDDRNFPSSGADLVFSVTGTTPQNQNTVLDLDAEIDSLTINDNVAVTIAGTNTLTISGVGANTGITVNSGAGLTTISSNLVLAGASDDIVVNNAAGLIISGQIAGTVGLTKSGSGTLTLTGAETYTGGTAITGGVLQLGNGVTAGSSFAASSLVTVDPASALALNLKSGETLANNVTNNGVVAALQSGVTTISGHISGGGNFLQNGAGRTILTGANTYTGSTVVGAGTLQVGDGATEKASIAPSSIVVVAGSDAVLAVNLTDGKAFANNVINTGEVTTIGAGTNIVSGIISGTGTFRQNGTGTTFITGQNTFTGLTTVEQGTLFVDGAVGGSTQVNAGTLGGNGTIAGNLTALNNSTVRAGSPTQPAGTLRVRGNYFQGGGATYIASLTAPNTNNVLAVNGRTRLNGTLQVDYINGFNATPGEEFTIIQSRRGVTGRFREFEDSHANDSLITLGVVYNRRSVVLKFGQGSFVLPDGLTSTDGLTPNQTAVAESLDELAENDSDSPLIAALNRLPIDQLPGAFDQLSPVEFAAIFDAGFAIARSEAGFIERRLEEIRDSSVEEVATESAPQSDGKTMFDDKDGKHMIAPETGRTREVAKMAPQHRWGFYLNGGAQAVEIDSDGRAAGSDFNTGSANLGVDYLLTDHIVIGATVGYSRINSDGSNGSEVTGDGAHGSLYASWFDRGFYVNGIVGGGYTSYDTERQGLGGTARGNTEGSHYTALIGTGYEHRIGGFTFGPIAALQYTTVSLDGFTEEGSLAPLRISDQTENSLQSRLGLRASYAWKIGKVVVTPEVRAQWQHEFQDTSRGISAGFAKDSNTAFTVRGPEIGRDSLLLEAGASVQWSPRVSTSVYYTGDLGAENYSSHSVNAGVRVSF